MLLSARILQRYAIDRCCKVQWWHGTAPGRDTFLDPPLRLTGNFSLCQRHISFHQLFLQFTDTAVDYGPLIPYTVVNDSILTMMQLLLKTTIPTCGSNTCVRQKILINDITQALVTGGNFDDRIHVRLFGQIMLTHYKRSRRNFALVILNKLLFKDDQTLSSNDYHGFFPRYKQQCR